MKPDVSADQLGELNLTPGRFNDLLEGHEELVQTLLAPGLRLRTEASEPPGPRVLAVGIGEDPSRSGEPALIVSVDKLPANLRGTLNATSRGAPVVYQEVGEILPAAGYQSRYRPAQPGISVGPYNGVGTGTIGCVVRSGAASYILSTNHVLANFNALPLGTAIIQPGQIDGGVARADTIASLSYFAPINPDGVSLADAAIAAIAPGAQVDPRIMRDAGMLQNIVLPVTQPVLNLRVQKSGRTTGFTNGKITMIAVTIVVQISGSATTTFNNVFVVSSGPSNFALGGDSGALITTDPGNQPVGLLFANDDRSNTYASPMSDVLMALAAATGNFVTIVT